MEEVLKPKHFFQDLYHVDIYFCPAFTEAEYEKAVRQRDPKYSVNLTGSGGWTTFTDGAVFIWLKGDKLENLGPLCHECIHAANFILDDRGIKQDTSNDEAVTYLAQWIYEKCIKHMRVR